MWDGLRLYITFTEINVKKIKTEKALAHESGGPGVLIDEKN
jgi:hypothetical protein